MKLVLSPQAALDLEEIGDYIARGSPKRAVLFIEQIEAHFQNILTAPNAYLFRNDLAANIQIAIHQRYLIFFRVIEKQIRIERILYSSRDAQNLLKFDS